MLYPDGSSIQPGDKVLLENGTIDGEVIEILDTPESKIQMGLKPEDQNSILVKRAGKRLICLTAENITADNIRLVSRASPES